MLTVREAAALPHTPKIRRYSHVGRLYLRDGDVPVRMLNDRESDFFIINLECMDISCSICSFLQIRPDKANS